MHASARHASSRGWQRDCSITPQGHGVDRMVGERPVSGRM